MKVKIHLPYSVFLWFGSLLLWKHQKLFKKINSSEAELDLKISIFGTRHVMSFVPITSYRKEIETRA